MNDAIQFLAGGGVTAPRGFAAGAGRGGIKTQGDDVALIAVGAKGTAAGVWTRNQVKAAPVLVCAEHAANATTRAIVVNAGNANCCTGAQGLADAREMCELAARVIGCQAREVLVCSTGIIGHKLPMEKIKTAIENIELDDGRAIDESVARATMTTDTRPKFRAARRVINGREVTVGGQAKGVGMIGPDMAPIQSTLSGAYTPAQNGRPTLHATMLAFLTTDADVEKQLLQSMLEAAVARSFNSVTVDGDTSTNDTALLLASGQSGVSILENERAQFQELLDAVCIELAKDIARDGEGATKLVTIEVEGAPDENAAKKIALSIANSPLVKTAIFGRDANWGRIAMAAGRAGVPFDAQKLGIQINDLEVLRQGEPLDFSEAEAQTAMSGNEVTIKVLCGTGEARWTAWTCDFSYDYVKINAEYHT